MTKPSDELLKRAYAQDASIYQETPQDVAFPASAEEVVALVRSGKPLIPRAAGTSLAGQVVGDGTVLDTGRHMNAIRPHQRGRAMGRGATRRCPRRTQLSS
jgi:FAD/FMN-containing dehydrogenase